MCDIYVINLKHRTDRMDNIIKNFNSYFNIVRIDAVYDKEGWKGCFESHLKCIRYAKEKNMKNIVVMEDDCCVINDNSIEQFFNIKKNILDIKDDWDIFVGGATRTLAGKISKYILDGFNNIYNVGETQCAHFIVYNHTCYDFYLNSDKSIPNDIIWYDKLKCIMQIPFLFTVIPSHSDITNVYTVHCKRIKNNQNKLILYIIENNLI